MRISYYVPSCTPTNSHGRYVIELAKRFSGAHQVTIFSGNFWPPLRSVVMCKHVPVPNRPALARMATLWASSALLRLGRLDEVIHIQGADAPVGNVVTAHFCNAAFHPGNATSSGPVRRLDRAIAAAAERFCMSKPSTRRIIAVSHRVKSEIEREYQIEPDRIEVIPNGVDLETFGATAGLPSREQLRGELGFSEDDFVVLFVGGDIHRKGLITLLRAVGQLPDRIRVLAVGAREEPAVTDCVRSGGLENRVKFVPRTTEMPPFYAAADCFALPSRYDPFSLAALEAMAGGIPVIVSSVAGICEHLTPEGDALLLSNPEDVQELQRHIERLSGDDQFRISLGVRARQTARQFSWESVAERTLSAYGRALS